MDDQRIQTPEIQFMKPPPIKWYGVSGEQLDRLKQARSQVGHDLSFALAALSVGLMALTTYLTVPQLADKQQTFFTVLMLVCAVVFLYTGIRWVMNRDEGARIIEDIKGSEDIKR